MLCWLPPHIKIYLLKKEFLKLQRLLVYRLFLTYGLWLESSKCTSTTAAYWRKIFTQRTEAVYWFNITDTTHSLHLLNQEHFKTQAKNSKILRVRLGRKANFPRWIGSTWNSVQNNNCGVQSYTNFFLDPSQTFEFSSGLSFSSVQLANCPNSPSKCHSTHSWP